MHVCLCVVPSPVCAVRLLLSGVYVQSPVYEKDVSTAHKTVVGDCLSDMACIYV